MLLPFQFSHQQIKYLGKKSSCDWGWIRWFGCRMLFGKGGA